MPHYHFVLSSRDWFIADTEGTELPDLAAAQQEAAKDVAHLHQARMDGRLRWTGWGDAGAGRAVLFEVPFTRSAVRARRRAGKADVPPCPPRLTASP